MKKNRSPKKPNFTFSDQTGDSTRSEHILALGRRIVEEFGLESSTDTLGRWMAHHVAELITKAETLTGEERILAEKYCFDTILTLWEHHAELPNGKRPFRDLEPVVRAIESLDPDNDTPRYFRSARPHSAQGKKKSDVDLWLETADGLDYSAKVLIGFCLAEAASGAANKSEEWVKLAEAAGIDGGISEIVIKFISKSADIKKKPDPSLLVRRLLQDRIKRLESFTRLAETFASDLKIRLDSLPPPPAGDEDDTDDTIVHSLVPPLKVPKPRAIKRSR